MQAVNTPMNHDPYVASVELRVSESVWQDMIDSFPLAAAGKEAIRAHIRLAERVPV